MNLNQFLRSRQPRWRRLSELLDRVDKKTLKGLTPSQADELFTLYRLVSSDLNLAQTHTGNPALLEYLESLVARAYTNLCIPKRGGFIQGWWRIIRHGFPQTIREHWSMLLLATLIFGGGVLFGFGATYIHPETADVFLPAEQLAESPAQRVARLEQLEANGETQIGSASIHAAFTSFLFTHNIRVSILCFVLGFTLGIGTSVLLFYNGAMLGSLAFLYLHDGVFEFFVAWIGPHGSIELPCVLFAGTAGLMIARAQFRRDHGTTRSQIRQMRPQLMYILVGSATLLILAGTIEGGFSQVNEPTLPYPLKIFVAALFFATLCAYLFVMPVKTIPSDDQSMAENELATMLAQVRQA